MTNVNGGGRRTRTFEAYAADLQSAPFATRDIPPFTRPPERGLIKTPNLKSIVKKTMTLKAVPYVFRKRFD